MRGAATERPRMPLFSYANIVSTLALALSFSIFYLSYVNVRHSLNVVAAPSVSFKVKVESFDVRADLVIRNDGNRTEAVLRAEPELSRSRPGVAAYYENLSLIQGPWVLKPGDAVPIHLEWRLTPNNLQFPSPPSLTSSANLVQANVTVNIVTVAPDGALVTTPIRLGSLEYQKNTGEFRFTRNAELDRRPLQPLLQ